MDSKDFLYVISCQAFTYLHRIYKLAVLYISILNKRTYPTVSVNLLFNLIIQLQIH